MPPCPAAASAGAPCASGGSSCWTRDTPPARSTPACPRPTASWSGWAVGRFQLTGRLSCGRDAQLELTRSEYLRLLSTARALRQERVYLLIKLFTSTGLPVHELEQVTVEAAGEGVLLLPGEAMPQRLPDCLRRELLDYARRRGISSGPIFVTRTGRPCGRAGVSVSIRRLCRDAQVPPEKGNPRCLRKLYYTTRAEIEATVAQLVEQTHERLLEAEQAAVGWGGCQEVRGA